MKYTEENISGICNLELGDVLLRRFALTDENDVFEFGTDHEVLKFLTWGGLTKKTQVRKFIKKAYIDNSSAFAIVHKQENKCIGVLELKKNIEKNCAVLGYLLNRHYWNLGIMTKIVKGVATFCFEKLNVSCLTASHFAGNYASGKVLTKAGFEIDIRAHQQVKVGDEYLEVVFYCLTKEKYEENKKKAAD